MLSKTAEYALRAVVWLASNPEQPAAAEPLADQTQVPRRYLHKVLQDLVRAGLVQSRSGPGGGYALQQPAKKITILDVVTAVDPPERIHHCPLGLKSHTSLCPLHHELDQSYAKMQAAFGKVTIHQLVNSTSPILPLCENRK